MSVRAAVVADLVQAGLPEAEARVYAFLAAVGAATAREIGEGAGVARTRVYAALEAIEARGLAETLLTEPRRFSALPLAPFLDRAIEKAERDALEAEDLRGRVAELFPATARDAGSAAGALRVARGRREASDALAQALLGAREARWLTSPEGVLRLANHPEGADAVDRIARGEFDARVALLVRDDSRAGAREEALALLGSAAVAVAGPRGLGARLVADGRLLLVVASAEDERAYRGEDVLVDTRVPALVADALALFERLSRQAP